MPSDERTSSANAAERAKRIKEEILKAKEVAGLAPPRLVPRGDAFRAQLSSRPTGAVSQEIDLPLVRGEVNLDFVGTEAEPDSPAKVMAVAVGPYRKAILEKAEAALQSLQTGRGSRLIDSVVYQLRLAAVAAPGDREIAQLLVKFDEVRFKGVTFKDEADRPGGSAPSA